MNIMNELLSDSTKIENLNIEFLDCLYSFNGIPLAVSFKNPDTDTYYIGIWYDTDDKYNRWSVTESTEKEVIKFKWCKQNDIPTTGILRTKQIIYMIDTHIETDDIFRTYLLKKEEVKYLGNYYK